MAGRMRDLGDTHGAGQRIVTMDRPYGEAMGFGRQIGGATDAEGILEATGTDFVVRKTPAYTKDGREIPGTFAVETDGRRVFQGTVGSRHEPFQNRETAGFCEALCRAVSGDLVMEAGGFLKDGAIVWYQGRIAQDLTVRQTPAGPDRVQPFIWVLNAHVGESALIAQFSANRLFCNNQVYGLVKQARGAHAWQREAALGKAVSRIAIRHSRNMRERVREAETVIHAALGFFEQSVAEMRELESRAMSADEARAFAEKLIGDTEESIAEAERTLTERQRNSRIARRDRLVHLFSEGLGNFGRTRLDMQNAVEEFEQHHVARRGGSTLRDIVLAGRAPLADRSRRLLLA